MNISTQKVAFYGLLFLVTAVSGIWLSHIGRPLNTLVFTVHKLSALATVILVGRALYQMAAAAGMGGVVAWSAIFAGLFFVALFVSGIFMSFERPFPAAILTVHQAAPLLALLATTAAVYLLAGAVPQH